jgi:hypothetical protein
VTLANQARAFDRRVGRFERVTPVLQEGFTGWRERDLTAGTDSSAAATKYSSSGVSIRTIPPAGQ